MTHQHVAHGQGSARRLSPAGELIGALCRAKAHVTQVGSKGVAGELRSGGVGA